MVGWVGGGWREVSSSAEVHVCVVCAWGRRKAATRSETLVPSSTGVLGHVRRPRGMREFCRLVAKDNANINDIGAWNPTSMFL